MLLVLDNYDSFTFNLVQYLGELAAEHPICADLRVERNDALSLEQIRALSPDAILISPGPGDPDQSGVCLKVLRELSPTVPTLGVCLGHQSMGQALGGRIIRAQRQMHGKASTITTDQRGVFSGLPQSFSVIRYHSLVVTKDSMPPGFVVTATADDDGEIMGLRHASHPTYGVQFHPESILTEGGYDMLRNFLKAVE